MPSIINSMYNDGEIIMRNVVNEIYEDYEKGLLSSKDASNKILVCLFKSPKLFGLYNMGEDEQSEFLLYLLEHMQNILLKYRRDLSTFSTYITSNIISLKKSWFREFYHKKAKQESIKYYIKTEEDYLMCENSVEYNPSAILDSHCNLQNLKKKDALTILILALKSCYYLTPNHIFTLAKITNYTEEDLFELKETLEKLMKKKIDSAEEKKERINLSYIKRNSCRLELDFVDENSYVAKRLRNNYNHYSRNWNYNMKSLKKLKGIKPSNGQLAQVLHMKEHAVYKILKEAKTTDHIKLLTV